jgi:hypothetical protein
MDEEVHKNLHNFYSSFFLPMEMQQLKIGRAPTQLLFGCLDACMRVRSSGRCPRARPSGRAPREPASVETSEKFASRGTAPAPFLQLAGQACPMRQPNMRVFSHAKVLHLGRSRQPITP